MKIYKYLVTIKCKTKNIAKIKELRSKLDSLLNRFDDEEYTECDIQSIKKSESIKVRSAKNKAVKLQNWVAEQISKITGIKYGHDELIQGREMGQSGVDIKLYGIAKEKYPFSVECKNEEKWDVPSYIRQAQDNQQNGTDWQVIFTKNQYGNFVIMDAKAWFDIWEQYLNMLYGKDHKIK